MFWILKHEARQACISGFFVVVCLFLRKRYQMLLLFQHLWILFLALSLGTREKVPDLDDGRVIYPSTKLLAFSFSRKDTWLISLSFRQLCSKSKINGFMSQTSNFSLFMNKAPLHLSTHPSFGFLVILSLSPLGKCKNHWLLKKRLSSRLASSHAKKESEMDLRKPLCIFFTLEWRSETDID